MRSPYEPRRQDQFDAAHRDARAAGPGLAGLLRVANALGVMGDTFKQMRETTVEKEGADEHEA